MLPQLAGQGLLQQTKVCSRWEYIGEGYNRAKIAQKVRFNGSAGSSFAGSTTPTISSALSNLPASSSSSNDFEIGSSQNLRGIGYHHFQETGPAERCGACVSCERAGCQLQWPASEVARRIAIAAVGRGIGIAVAARVVVVIEAETAVHKTTPVLETSVVAEVACLGKVPTGNAARETAASSAEVASAKGAAYASAAAEAPHVSAAEATDMAAAEAADVAAAEAASVSTPEAPTTVSTTPAARKRVSGQSAGERGSRRQDDHGLT